MTDETDIDDIDNDDVDYEKEQELCDAISAILKRMYADCDENDCDTDNLAYELCDCVLYDNANLYDILSIVYDFEEEMREVYGAKIEVGRQCAVYNEILRLLEINEVNAHRLCKAFLSYNDIQCFSFLMNEFREFLTDEEVEKIMEIAKSSFLPFIWEQYI